MKELIDKHIRLNKRALENYAVFSAEAYIYHKAKIDALEELKEDLK